MRVLFVEVDTESSWATASIGPSFLGAFLRRHGHEAAFLRAPLAMTSQELVAKVRALEPGLLALSLTTRQWLRAKALVKDLRRELDLPVVAGGLHPTYSTEDVLASEGFDYACLGEGEEALLDLVRVVERGGRILDGTIPNIWVKGGKRPFLRKPIEPLDALPFMARDLLDERHGVVNVTTQRGCPFPCTYCAARQYEDLYEGNGDYGRRRSHENVLAELDEIRRNGPLNFVIFLDDTFTIHHPWVKAFCKLYGERFRIPFSLHARVETVNPELIDHIARAGCKHIVFGVESGSPRVRKDVMHRPVSNERFEEVFRWTREAGLITTANYILGVPGETRADLEQTLELHERLQPDDFGYFVFYPYPGTALFHLCKEKGYLPEDYLERPANHRESILDLPDLTREDIAWAYDAFTRSRERNYLARYAGNSTPEQREALVADLRRAAVTG